MQSLALLVLFFPALQEPRPLASTIQDVTVFADRALVKRVADVPAGGGAFVVSGLPLGADPEQIRVRSLGGDVAGVDVTEVREPVMPDARREELRRQLLERQREFAALLDERGILQASIDAASGLLLHGSGGSKTDLTAGKLDVAGWSSAQDALLVRLRTQRKALRELEEQRAEVERVIEELKTALGSSKAAGGVVARQVALEVVAGGPSVLEIEYVVGNAGWHPVYDLRAARDARSVELVYRAQVFQQSGEDWNDVDMSLSTAEPQVGAQGPDPMPLWVRLFDRGGKYPGASASAVLREDGFALGRDLDAPAAPAAEAPPPPRPFATVESQGLSVRFHLPRRETLVSRLEPTRVLVTQETLKVTPEYFCTPALDRNVWLRGLTKNDTQWTILPGRAAVYFGADFLGHAQLEAVQPGEEFTVHLGRDPGLTFERVQTENEAKQPGVFGSRTTQVDAWRVTLENHGALVTRPDGTATVFVREALPRATDDRIKVELADLKPEPSEDGRWKKDREEQGFVTWVVQVPRGGETRISWRVKVTYPEGMGIRR